MRNDPPHKANVNSNQLKEEAIVYLVDDDEHVLDSLVYVLTCAGYRCQAYQAPESLLQEDLADGPACIVMDLAMPGMTGLELLKELKQQGKYKPALMLTSRGSVPSAVEAMKLGAMDFLEKPIEHTKLLSLVERMLTESQENRVSRFDAESIRGKFALLTPREKEIVQLVSEGVPTKSIATRLNLSIKTIEVHRSNLSRKFGAKSMSNLILMLSKAGATIA